MKILHLSNDYYGTALYRNLLEALNHINDTVNTMIVCCQKNEEHDAEAGVIPLYLLNRTDRVSYLHKQHKMMRAIEKNVDMSKYDTVHAHFLFTNGGIAYKLKKKYGIPYVVTVRNADVNLFFRYRKYLNGYANKILENANAVTFLSDAYRIKVIENYVDKNLRDLIYAKSSVIPNGIDPIWLENRCTHRRKSGEKKLNIVFAGKINRNKNLLTTIAACKKLIYEGYDVCYTAIGQIGDQKIFKKLEAEDIARILPPKAKEELIEIYKTQDVFVMPSITESFGLVYAEAMSQGLPIIYSKGQGFDGHFPQGQVGFAVHSMDAAEIAQAVKNILNDYDKTSLYCAKSSMRFNWDEIAARYFDCYHITTKGNYQINE